MCEDCYDTLPPLTTAEKRRQILFRAPGVLDVVRMYYKARGRAKCIAAIVHGDAVIFGATIRGGKISAGSLYATLGVGELTVAESTIERCDVTAIRTNVQFHSQIVSNFLRRPGDPDGREDPIRTQLVR